MYFSPELLEAIRIRGAVDRRSLTSLVEEACWQFLEDKGGKEFQDKRIERLLSASRQVA